MFSTRDFGMFVRALSFAADKHQNQRRKGRDQLPYVNHLIRVTDMLWRVGEVRNIPTLLAALLHDTLEDTDTTAAELAAFFGAEVLALVQEATDDKALPKAARKQLQIEHAPHLSNGARLIKLADKIDNVYDVSHNPPQDWPHERLVAYLDWAEAVVAGLRGVNVALEAHFDIVLDAARDILMEKKSP